MECGPASQARDLFSARGNVLIEVRAVELEGALQPVGERRRRAPSERRADFRRVGVEISDIDRLLVRWPRGAPEPARAGSVNHQLDEIAVPDRLEAADVEHLSIRR